MIPSHTEFSIKTDFFFFGCDPVARKGQMGLPLDENSRDLIRRWN